MTTKYPELQTILEKYDYTLKDNDKTVTIGKAKIKDDTPVDINFKIALTLVFIGVLFLIFVEPMLIGALLLAAAAPYFLRASKAKAGEANIHGKKVIFDKEKIRIGPDIDFFEVEKPDLRGLTYKIEENGKLVTGSLLALTAINGETNFELLQIVGQERGELEEDLKVIANNIVGILTHGRGTVLPQNS